MNFTTENVTFPIIGYVHSPLSQKFGIPRQPNLVNVPAYIEIIPPFLEASAFDGLEKFSHVWLLWLFHQNKSQDKIKFRPQVRPPRLGGNQKIGVFATRSMYRPANIGLSVIQLINIDISKDYIHLHILGADMVDGTPVLDIKPYLNYSDSITNATVGFATQSPMLKPVITSDDATEQVKQFIHHQQLTKNDWHIIQQLIAQDPRPAYRQQETTTIFTMRYRQFDIGFYMNENQIFIIQHINFIQG